MAVRNTQVSDGGISKHRMAGNLAALMMGLTHTLIEEDLCNAGFLRTNTVGFEPSAPIRWASRMISQRMRNGPLHLRV